MEIGGAMFFTDGAMPAGEFAAGLEARGFGSVWGAADPERLNPAPRCGRCAGYHHRQIRPGGGPAGQDGPLAEWVGQLNQ